MTTRTISGSFALPGTGGTAGAAVSAWAADRFAGIPPGDSAPPSGAADYGPVKTGTKFGAPGAYLLVVDNAADYWVSTQYGGHTYWTFSAAGGAGGIVIVDHGDTLSLTPTPPVTIVDDGVGLLTITD